MFIHFFSKTFKTDYFSFGCAGSSLPDELSLAILSRGFSPVAVASLVADPGL